MLASDSWLDPGERRTRPRRLLARVDALDEAGNPGGAGPLGGFLATEQLDLLGLPAGLQPEAFVRDAAFAGDRGDQQQRRVKVRWVVGEAVLEAVDHVEVRSVAWPIPDQPGLALLGELGRGRWRVKHDDADHL